MILKELKNMLNGMPEQYDNHEVILQKDSEGNGYSPLYCVDPECIYMPDSSWDVEVMSLEWSADDAGMDEEEWEETKRERQKCIIFVPAN
jgi:hypothetical protein